VKSGPKFDMKKSIGHFGGRNFAGGRQGWRHWKPTPNMSSVCHIR